MLQWNSGQNLPEALGRQLRGKPVWLTTALHAAFALDVAPRSKFTEPLKILLNLHHHDVGYMMLMRIESCVFNMSISSLDY